MSYLTDAKLPTIIGNDNFREAIDAYVKSHSLSAEIVGADKIILPPKIEYIVKEVAAYFGVHPEKIYSPSQRVINKPRSIAIYICRELGGYQLTELAKTMGKVSYKSISTTIQRTKFNKNLMREANLIMNKISVKKI